MLAVALDILLKLALACFWHTSDKDLVIWWNWRLHASNALHFRILFLDRSKSCILPAHFWQGLKICCKRTCGLDLIHWWMWSLHFRSSSSWVSVTLMEGRQIAFQASLSWFLMDMEPTCCSWHLTRSGVGLLPANFWEGFYTLMEVELTCFQCTSP